MLRYADHLIGRMVKSLDELGLRENTIVIVTTDNGTDTGADLNYWDRWYLGFDLGQTNSPDQSQRFRKLPSEGEPRTGAYKTLVENGHDLVELHTLMASRPFLVSGEPLIHRSASLH